ncbi:transposase [Gordonia sp. (in: high G+C Gram-positive bacteria)]|uniref:transposase n=1 Tax=Gordonia sp. (in: high G+C Gram-positive bacteria) TaxID=84139 RepID=UPI003BB73313
MELSGWLREYAVKNRCHGFRRVWAALRHDEGRHINKKKVHRLWSEEGLQRRFRSARKRVGESSVPPAVEADAPKVVWSIDFQFDSTVDGRAIKIASGVDAHTKQSVIGLFAFQSALIGFAS